LALGVDLIAQAFAAEFGVTLTSPEYAMPPLRTIANRLRSRWMGHCDSDPAVDRQSRPSAVDPVLDLESGTRRRWRRLERRTRRWRLRRFSGAGRILGRRCGRKILIWRV